MRYLVVSIITMTCSISAGQLPGGFGEDPFVEPIINTDVTYGRVESVELNLDADPLKPGVWDVDGSADYKAHVSALSLNDWRFPYSLGVYNGGEGIGSRPFRASGTIQLSTGSTATWSTSSAGAETTIAERHMALALVRGLEIGGPGTTAPSRKSTTADPQ